MEFLHLLLIQDQSRRTTGSYSVTSIYINDLLYQLSGSGYGATIDGNFCGSPMYADDLALIANSSTDLQAMLKIVFSFSVQWRYQLNAPRSLPSKSLVNQQQAMPEITHLVSGSWVVRSFLRRTLTTTLEFFVLSPIHLYNPRTSERCSSSRRAFSSLSMVLGLRPAASTHLHLCACTKYTASLFSSTGEKCCLSHMQS